MNPFTEKKWDGLQASLGKLKFLNSNNPVILSLKNGQMSLAQGIETLKQYYYLVVTIVQFLTIAMVRISVPEAKEELRRNLAEELGSRTNGVFHQELLETLLKNELDIRLVAK